MSLVACVMMPTLNLSPDMVNVLPEPLCPYANTVPAHRKRESMPNNKFQQDMQIK
jgi:hypothetical protein